MPFNCSLHPSIWQFSFFSVSFPVWNFSSWPSLWFSFLHNFTRVSSSLVVHRTCHPTSQRQRLTHPHSALLHPLALGTLGSAAKILIFGHTDPGKRKLVRLSCWFVRSWRYPGSFWQFSFCRNRFKVWTKCAQICWRKSVRRSVNLKVEVCHWGGSGVQGSSSRLERVEAKWVYWRAWSVGNAVEQHKQKTFQKRQDWLSWNPLIWEGSPWVQCVFLVWPMHGGKVIPTL